MDFSFSDEQQMLQDTTRRFIASEYSHEKRTRILQSQQGWSREVWNGLAELGLLTLEVPESYGGMGTDPVAAMLVAQAAGECMLLEPLLSSAVLATRALSQLGSEQQRERWMPGLANGSVVAVLAHDEPDACIDVAAIKTRASCHDEGWRLNGRKSIVYHAPAANLLLVSAREEIGSIGVYAIAPDAPGVAQQPIRTVDGQCAADIILDDVAVAAADRLPGDEGRLQAALDYGLAIFCAEALGNLEVALNATIEYSRTRVQFGVPIGSFQALQHRMADMLTHVEQARSMVYLAISHCLDPDPSRRRRVLSAAKALIGQTARFVSQQAIQLHGGMGMADEIDVSHHAKRLFAFESRFGTTDEHRAVYRELLVQAMHAD